MYTDETRMEEKTAIRPSRIGSFGLRLLLRMAMGAVFASCLTQAVAAPPSDAALSAALKFLATQQQPDGSFGGPQPHLKAAFATLAALSTGERNTPGLAGRAVAY